MNVMQAYGTVCALVGFAAGVLVGFVLTRAWSKR
jgi:hypothetical protein